MSTAAAAVLARLWGACAREPLDGIAQRLSDGPDLVVMLSDGRVVRGPQAAAQPFAPAPEGLGCRIDGITFTDPGEFATALLGTHSPAARRFRDEIDNSVANLTLARAAQPAPTGGPDALPSLAGRPDALAYLEQSVVDGHPLHPLCRTRMGMSAQDVMRYGPEFRPTIDLTVVAVPPERWRTTGIGLPPRLPMHPWQRDHLLDAHPMLRPTGETIRARPLMSLRTVALADDPAWHLKTSIDVQMTSAVRIVSPAAIHNGPLVSALLATLTTDEPLDVLAEVAAGAVLVDGSPARSLAVVLRAAPGLGPGEVALPFAVLSTPSPASGRAFICEAIGAGDPAAFFTELVTLTIPPLLRLLNRGIALEAHGQNTLLVLRDGRPVRVLYRDMGGVRISPRRLAAAGIGEPPPLLGDLTTDDPDTLRTKLAAALLSTVVAEIVATLSREYALAPASLWRTVAGVIRATYRDLPTGARGDEAAMLGPTLPIKAMTAMRLSPQPLEDIWTPIENPMAAT
jgi:siderophore synthetase component